MNARAIRTRNGVSGVVRVPGSKSIANRALIMAALAPGVSTLSNVPSGDDTVAMIDALNRLGLKPAFEGGSIRITGPLDRNATSSVTLDANLAGTTSRFLTALGAVRCGSTTIDGGEPLRRRPNVDLRNALLQLGAVIESPVRDGLPITLRGKLDLANEVAVDGSMSSQFTSALMMIGSVIDGGLRLNLRGTPVSRSYIDLTAGVMAQFGVQVEIDEDSVWVDGSTIRACDLAVEADASSASYPLAAAAISGGSVEVLGLGDTSGQSDALFRDLLRQMGCEVATTKDNTTVRRNLGKALAGISTNLAEASDLVPTLAAVCCFADSRSEITGVGFIRKKESNRIEGLADQLNRCGARVTPTPDGLIIDPSEMHGAIIDPMHDHRIAMALALVGLRVSGVEISDPGVVSKSWPDYWSVLDAL